MSAGEGIGRTGDGDCMMVIALIVCGVVSLLIGAAFYWLNLNSPVQTCIPAVCVPLGAALLLLALGGTIL